MNGIISLHQFLINVLDVLVDYIKAHSGSVVHTGDWSHIGRNVYATGYDVLPKHLHRGYTIPKLLNGATNAMRAYIKAHSFSTSRFTKWTPNRFNHHILAQRCVIKFHRPLP